MAFHKYFQLLMLQIEGSKWLLNLTVLVISCQLLACGGGKSTNDDNFSPRKVAKLEAQNFQSRVAMALTAELRRVYEFALAPEDKVVDKDFRKKNNYCFDVESKDKGNDGVRRKTDWSPRNCKYQGKLAFDVDARESFEIQIFENNIDKPTETWIEKLEYSTFGFKVSSENHDIGIQQEINIERDPAKRLSYDFQQRGFIEVEFKEKDDDKNSRRKDKKDKDKKYSLIWTFEHTGKMLYSPDSSQLFVYDIKMDIEFEKHLHTEAREDSIVFAQELSVTNKPTSNNPKDPVGLPQIDSCGQIRGHFLAEYEHKGQSGDSTEGKIGFHANKENLDFGRNKVNRSQCKPYEPYFIRETLEFSDQFKRFRFL